MKRWLPSAAIALLVVVLTPAAAVAASVDARADSDAATSPAALSALLPSQRAQFTAADGAVNDNFGYALAVSGDVAVVGAPYHDVGTNADQGCVYVFVRSGASWLQQAQLSASDGAAGDRFGNAVALVGETIIVGTPYDDVGTNADQGSAYVFVRSGTTWTLQAQLSASDGAPGDGFGCSVAFSGETALVGANEDDVGANADQGSAYVFVRSAVTWSQQQQLISGDGAANDRFGYSVALVGDSALVGANRHDVGANADQGCAYIFTRSDTTWSQQQQLTAADGAANDRFGYAVALSADAAAISAPYDDVGTRADQGSAYVFVRNDAAWGQQQQLTAADGAASDLFGYAVALYGNTAVVGAFWDDIGTRTNQGSAYVFLSSGAAWSQHEQITAADGAANDRFGCAVALSAETVLVGAYWDDVGANTRQGSTYVYPPDGVAPTTSAEIAPAPNSYGWNAAAVTVSLHAGDPFSGVASSEYRLAGAASWTPYMTPFSVASPGFSWWEYRSTDLAGNVEPTKTLAVQIDDSTPVSKARLAPAANASGWRRSAVTLTLSASDSVSWASSIQYHLTGAAAWTTYGAPFKVARQGLSTYEHRALDVAGNLEATKSLTIRIDSKRPTTKAYAASVRRGKMVALRYKVLDARPGCGKAKVALRIYKGKKVVRTLKAGPYTSNVTRSCRWRCLLKPGRYTLKVYATDIAGNPQAKIGSALMTVR